MIVRFEVLGVPVPQGSKRGYYSPKLSRVMLIEASPKTQPWRDSVTAAAAAAYPIEHFPKISGPVKVQCLFAFPFRSGDLRKDGTPKIPAGSPKESKPDIDKLLRSVLDAVTASAIWIDDAQVTSIEAQKVYSERPRAEIAIFAHTLGADQK